MARRIMTSVGRTCSTPYTQKDKKKTLPGLAMTPAQVKQLAERGIPVSTAGMQEFYDGEKGWRVEPMFARGADINQLWEMEHVAQSRVLSARKKDINRYGRV